MIWNLIYHQCSGATLSHISTHVFMFYTIYNTFTSTKSYQGFPVTDINICAFFFHLLLPFPPKCNQDCPPDIHSFINLSMYSYAKVYLYICVWIMGLSIFQNGIILYTLLSFLLFLHLCMESCQINWYWSHLFYLMSWKCSLVWISPNYLCISYFWAPTSKFF